MFMFWQFTLITLIKTVHAQMINKWLMFFIHITINSRDNYHPTILPSHHHTILPSQLTHRWLWFSSRTSWLTSRLDSARSCVGITPVFDNQASTIKSTLTTTLWRSATFGKSNLRYEYIASVVNNHRWMFAYEYITTDSVVSPLN